MTQFSIHGIKTISAETAGMSGGFKIALTDEHHWHGDSQVLIFIEDAVLSERLAAAINQIVAEREAEIETAKQPETEAA